MAVVPALLEGTVVLQLFVVLNALDEAIKVEQPAVCDLNSVFVLNLF